MNRVKPRSQKRLHKLLSDKMAQQRISQIDLGEKLGYSNMSVFRWLKDIDSIRVETLIDLCRVLKVSQQELAEAIDMETWKED